LKKGFCDLLIYTCACGVLYTLWKIYKETKKLEVTEDILEFCDMNHSKGVSA